MTISCNLANITNAIAAISVSGVTVKDKDEIAGSWVGLPNVLYPRPDGFITDFEVVYDTVLRGTTAPLELMYTLNYRFLGVQVGDMGAFAAAYSALIDKVILIVNAMITADGPYSGKVDMVLGGITDIGPLADPAGNLYYGADIALNIVEMQN